VSVYLCTSLTALRSRIPCCPYIALVRLGMPIIDVAEVEGLARACVEQDRSEFLFALGPMPVLGATGVPVNPLAIF